MPRRVYFSFHPDLEAWRAKVVLDCWVAGLDHEAAGCWDPAAWQQARQTGEEAVRHMINRALEQTSVTVVLIGSRAREHEWAVYEIQKSYQRRNGLLGIYIHGIADAQGRVEPKGENPFATLYLEETNHPLPFSRLYPSYDWVKDEGPRHVASWIVGAR